MKIILSIDYVALAQNKEMLNKTQNTDIVDSEDKRIVVPAGFMITTDTKLVKEGIVIEDKNGNQFVWIEVPNYQEFIDDKEFKDSNYRDLVTEQNYIDMSKNMVVFILDDMRQVKIILAKEMKSRM